MLRQKGCSLKTYKTEIICVASVLSSHILLLGKHDHVVTFHEKAGKKDVLTAIGEACFSYESGESDSRFDGGHSSAENGPL